MSQMMSSTEPLWIVYIVKCRDNTLYTGITNQLEHRIQQHDQGRGAKYTKGRGPVEIVYTEHHPSRSLASKREARLKRLTRSQKLALILR